MSKDDLRAADFLSHILQAISRIERYTEDLTQVAFLENEQVQDAVIRNIEIIGEAARNIEKHHPGFAERHSNVPWAICTSCATVYHMATSRLTLRLSGRPSRPIYQDWLSK